MVAIATVDLGIKITHIFKEYPALSAMADKRGLANALKFALSSTKYKKQTQRIIIKAISQSTNKFAKSLGSGKLKAVSGDVKQRKGLFSSKIDVSSSFLSYLFNDEKITQTTIATSKKESVAKINFGPDTIQFGEKDFLDTNFDLEQEKIDLVIKTADKKINRNQIIKIVEEFPQLIKEIENKATTIIIPYGFGNTIVSKVISFNWQDLKKIGNFSIRKTNAGFNLHIDLSAKTINKIFTAFRNSVEDYTVTLEKDTSDLFTALLVSQEITKLKQRLKGETEVITVLNFVNRAELEQKMTDKQKGQMVRFASSAELSSSIQKSLFARMPKGPRRGAPISNKMLTNRTGRFVKSVNAFVNFREQLIQYYYDPRYFTHEETGRDPRELIEQSIRNLVGKTVANQFRIIKSL